MCVCVCMYLSSFTRDKCIITYPGKIIFLTTLPLKIFLILLFILKYCKTLEKNCSNNTRSHDPQRITQSGVTHPIHQQHRQILGPAP